MKRKTIITMLMLAFILAFVPQRVEAASKKTKALKAYAKYIGTSSSTQFALADINKDGVKELFLLDNLYVYKSGKVVKNQDLSWAWGIVYYPNKNYIYAERVGVFDDDTGYFRLTKSGKIKELARKNKNTYKVNGKKVTKSRYNSYVKKLTKKSKKLKLKYYDNTTANRKKYLKSGK